MPSKGQQCSELCLVFSEPHTRGGAEYEQASRRRDPEESLFDPPKSLSCQRAATQPLYGTEAENRIGGSDKEGNMPVLP